MREKGISSDELLYVTKDKLGRMFGNGKTLPDEKLDDFYKHYEYKR